MAVFYNPPLTDTIPIQTTSGGIANLTAGDIYNALGACYFFKGWVSNCYLVMKLNQTTQTDVYIADNNYISIGDIRIGVNIPPTSNKAYRWTGTAFEQYTGTSYNFTNVAKEGITYYYFAGTGMPEGVLAYDYTKLYFNGEDVTPVSAITSNGGGATHIAKRAGLLSSIGASNLSDILMVSGGGGGGLIIGDDVYAGKDAGGIAGNGNNSANQTTGYAFGQGESDEGVSGGGGGLYGGYKGGTS